MFNINITKYCLNPNFLFFKIFISRSNRYKILFFILHIEFKFVKGYKWTKKLIKLCRFLMIQFGTRIKAIVEWFIVWKMLSTYYEKLITWPLHTVTKNCLFIIFIRNRMTRSFILFTLFIQSYIRRTSSGARKNTFDVIIIFKITFFLYFSCDAQ